MQCHHLVLKSDCGIAGEQSFRDTLCHFNTLQSFKWDIQSERFNIYENYSIICAKQNKEITDQHNSLWGKPFSCYQQLLEKYIISILCQIFHAFTETIDEIHNQTCLPSPFHSFSVFFAVLQMHFLYSYPIYIQFLTPISIFLLPLMFNSYAYPLALWLIV